MMVDPPSSSSSSSFEPVPPATPATPATPAPAHPAIVPAAVQSLAARTPGSRRPSLAAPPPSPRSGSSHDPVSAPTVANRIHSVLSSVPKITNVSFIPAAPLSGTRHAASVRPRAAQLRMELRTRELAGPPGGPLDGVDYLARVVVPLAYELFPDGTPTLTAVDREALHTVTPVPALSDTVAAERRCTATGRKVVLRSAAGRRVVEVWAGSALVASEDVTDLHQDFITDEMYGSLDIDGTTSTVIYSAEANPPEGHKYDYLPSLGEKAAGHKRPTIYRFKWSETPAPDDITSVVSALPPKGRVVPLLPAPAAIELQNIIFAQASLLAAVEGEDKASQGVVATGYQPLGNGNRLGVIYCSNRPSDIYLLTYAATDASPSAAKFRWSNLTASTTQVSTTQKPVDGKDFAWRRPQVRTGYRVDAQGAVVGQQQIFALGTAREGPHRSADFLRCLVRSVDLGSADAPTTTPTTSEPVDPLVFQQDVLIAFPHPLPPLVPVPRNWATAHAASGTTNGAPSAPGSNTASPSPAAASALQPELDLDSLPAGGAQQFFAEGAIERPFISYSRERLDRAAREITDDDLLLINGFVGCDTGFYAIRLGQDAQGKFQFEGEFLPSATLLATNGHGLAAFATSSPSIPPLLGIFTIAPGRDAFASFRRHEVSTVWDALKDSKARILNKQLLRLAAHTHTGLGVHGDCDAIVLAPFHAQLGGGRNRSSSLSLVRRGITAPPGSSLGTNTLPGTAPPTILFPHGGPHSATGYTFDPSRATLALLGYQVILPNYSGSVGKTDSFVRRLMGRVGDLDIKDCALALDQLVSKRVVQIDPQLVFVSGGSHGGFIGAHLLGQYPGKFRSAALRNPVIDMAAMVHTTDIPDWTYAVLNLPYPYPQPPMPVSIEALQQMRDASPIAHVDQIQDPMLLLLGEADQRVPPAQSRLIYHALRQREADVSLLSFPNADHALETHAAQETAFDATFALFERTGGYAARQPWAQL